MGDTRVKFAFEVDIEPLFRLVEELAKVPGLDKAVNGLIDQATAALTDIASGVRGNKGWR